VGRKKRLEAFSPLTYIKWKQCQKEKEDVFGIGVKESKMNWLQVSLGLGQWTNQTQVYLKFVVKGLNELLTELPLQSS
jgi:hypothetical protein